MDNQSSKYTINQDSSPLREPVANLFSQANTSSETELFPFSGKQATTFTFIDLFAGIGGFRLAFQKLGGLCVFSSEWDKAAQQTYAANFGEIPEGDITLKSTKDKIPSNFDILCAGFPCQAFSIAGKQKGFSDTRGTLFFDISQILSIHRPKGFILENVKNLTSHDKGNTFKVIENTLTKDLGYEIKYKVLNSMTHANIPQNRERIFIVGMDPDQVSNFSRFEFPGEIPLTKGVRDIIFKEKQAEKYYYKKEHKYYDELSQTMTNRDTLYQWRRVYVRENKNNVCPTLTANMGTGGHNVPLVLDSYGIRKLTPKECLLFQGFPDNYRIPLNLVDSKIYKQAGNSVTVPLIERIAKNMLDIMI